MTEPIENALLRLKESAAVEKAAGDLEARLMVSFRAHHASRKRRRVWVPATLVASLVIGVWWRLAAPPKLDPDVQVARSTVEQPEQRFTQNAGIAAPKPVSRRKAIAKRAPVRKVAARPPLPAQDFIEIPYAPALTDYDGGRVVRVNMPGASVRSLGVPVLSDRVQADVFLGDDGIARAIRVVSSSGLNYRR